MKNIFKPKYKFNPETLQYEKITFSFKRFILRAIQFSFSSIIFGAGLMFVYILVYDSPEEKILKRENRILKETLKEINIKLDNTDKLLDDIAKRDNYIYRSTFQQDSISYDIRNAGTGGTNRYKHLEGYESTDVLIETSKKLDKVEQKLKVQENSFRDIIAEIRKNEKFYKNFPFLQPIRTNELTRIGSFYGYRPHPILGVVHMHQGIDLVAPTGTPVYASGDGIVKSIERNNTRSGYGNSVLIDHQVNGFASRYAHLHTIEVREGQKVKRGQRIGTVGNTGLSTSPHLHYEIIINGATTNPLRFMITPKPDEYEQLIKLTEHKGVSFD
jgi:murein DD-endopeptidase MepM/ murein hydrolase activator NlpD